MELTIAGTNFRKDVDLKLLNPSVKLWLEYEPSNEYDPNAIAVYSEFGHLGYVSKTEQEAVKNGNELKQIKFLKAEEPILDGKPTRVIWYSTIETKTMVGDWEMSEDRFRSKNGSEWFPNVTKILSAINEKGDVDWNKHYEANVTKAIARLRNGEHFDIPSYISDAGGFLNYRARVGSTIHEAIETNSLTKEILDKYNTREDLDFIKNALEGFVRFKRDYAVDVIGTEIVVEHKGVASPLDLLVKVGGKLTVIDIKTTSKKKLKHEIQVTMYGDGYEKEFKKRVDRAILYIPAKNKNKYQYITEDKFRNTRAVNRKALDCAIFLERHFYH